MISDNTPQAGWSGDLCTLPHEISAIQVLPAGEDRARMGMIVSIPQSAEIEVCGIGFNDRTIRICWNGSYYFAFREDLGKPSKEQAEAQATGTSG